jgi:hypothetical protein
VQLAVQALLGVLAPLGVPEELDAPGVRRAVAVVRAIRAAQRKSVVVEGHKPAIILPAAAVHLLAAADLAPVHRGGAAHRLATAHPIVPVPLGVAVSAEVPVPLAAQARRVAAALLEAAAHPTAARPLAAAPDLAAVTTPPTSVMTLAPAVPARGPPPPGRRPGLLLVHRPVRRQVLTAGDPRQIPPTDPTDPTARKAGHQATEQETATIARGRPAPEQAGQPVAGPSRGRRPAEPTGAGRQAAHPRAEPIAMTAAGRRVHRAATGPEQDQAAARKASAAMALGTTRHPGWIALGRIALGHGPVATTASRPVAGTNAGPTPAVPATGHKPAVQLNAARQRRASHSPGPRSRTRSHLISSTR